MKNAFTKNETRHDEWNVLNEDELDKVLVASKEKPQLIYKHSHTCSICHVALEEIEEQFDAIKAKADMHFLNVIKSRPVSNAVAKKLDVRHESPQALLIKHGECVWNKSHWSIKADAILEALKN